MARDECWEIELLVLAGAEDDKIVIANDRNFPYSRQVMDEVNQRNQVMRVQAHDAI